MTTPTLDVPPYPPVPIAGIAATSAFVTAALMLALSILGLVHIRGGRTPALA